MSTGERFLSLFEIFTKKSKRSKGKRQIPPTKGPEPYNVQKSLNNDTLFPIVLVKLTCGSIVSPTFAFLDSGSFVSLIDKKVADQLKRMDR